MIFYRLALQRLIDYLQIGKLSKEQERRQILLHKKPKEDFKIKLITDRTLNLYISILLSIIGILVSLSIPFALLKRPCDILQEREMFILYSIARVVENYSDVLDYFIVVFIIMLVYVSVRTVLDAIKRTKINISPWIQRGKYTLPSDKSKTSVSLNDPNGTDFNYERLRIEFEMGRHYYTPRQFQNK